MTIPSDTRVVAVIDGHHFVLNKGLQDGLDAGMRVIVAEPPISVYDPETGEFLDVIQRTKLVATVVTCYERCCVCAPVRPPVEPGDWVEQVTTEMFGSYRDE